MAVAACGTNVPRDPHIGTPGTVTLRSAERMGIRFQCPNGHKLNVKADLAGKRASCPECGVKLVIPAGGPSRTRRRRQLSPTRRRPPTPCWFARTAGGGQLARPLDAMFSAWIAEGQSDRRRADPPRRLGPMEAGARRGRRFAGPAGRRCPGRRRRNPCSDSGQLLPPQAENNRSPSCRSPPGPRAGRIATIGANSSPTPSSPAAQYIRSTTANARRRSSCWPS